MKRQLRRFGRMALVITTILSVNFTTSGLAFSSTLPSMPDPGTGSVDPNSYLHLEKLLDADSPAGMANYSIKYVNTGPVALFNITLVDTLPPELSYVSSDPSGSFDGVQTVSWAFDKLDPFSGAELHISTVVNNEDLAECVKVTNQIVFEASRPDASIIPHPGYERLSTMDSSTHEVCPHSPDLEVTKKIATGGEQAGFIDYIIAYDNHGDWPAYDVVITDTLPTGLMDLELDPAPDTMENGVATWTMPMLEADGHGHFQVRMYFDASVSVCGPIVNQITIAQDWQLGEPAISKEIRYSERNLDNNSDEVMTDTHYGECDGAIKGQKWLDVNGDKTWNEGEAPLAGWTINVLTACSNNPADYDYEYNDGQVTLPDFVSWTNYYNSHNPLADLNGDGQFTKLDLHCFGILFNGGSITEPYTVMESQVTDADGQYAFMDLIPGAYWLSETQQSNWAQMYPMTEVSGPFVIGEATVIDEGTDFGNFELGSIAGSVWNDLNSDGLWQTEAENGLPGWTVVLTMNGEEIVPIEESMVTNAQGDYSFTGLMAGDYQLSLTAPAGWSQTFPVNPATHGPLAIQSGSDIGDKDFGVVLINQETPEEPLPEEPPIIVPPATPPVVPVLTLSKTVNVTSFVNPGAVVNYTVTVKNTGTTPAKNLLVTDSLPAAMFFTDALGSTRTLVPGGDLGAGETLTLTYPATVKADAVNGTYTNTVRLTADNHATLTAGVPIEVRQPAVLGDEALPLLTIDKKTSQTFANPGDIVTYTVTIANTGDAPALNVSLHDVLPAGATFTETGGTVRDWLLGTLEQGKTKTVVYEATISDTAPAGSLMNTAVLRADTIDPLTSQADIDVRVPEVLGAETTADGGTLAATGAGMFDYLLVFAASVVVLAGVTWSVRRQLVPVKNR